MQYWTEDVIALPWAALCAERNHIDSGGRPRKWNRSKRTQNNNVQTEIIMINTSSNRAGAGGGRYEVKLNAPQTSHRRILLTWAHYLISSALDSVFASTWTVRSCDKFVIIFFFLFFGLRSSLRKEYSIVLYFSVIQISDLFDGIRVEEIAANIDTSSVHFMGLSAIQISKATVWKKGKKMSVFSCVDPDLDRNDFIRCPSAENCSNAH